LPLKENRSGLIAIEIIEPRLLISAIYT